MAEGERISNCPLCGSRELTPFFEKDGFELERCGGCELVLVANPPTPEELDRLYSFSSGYHVAFRDDPREIELRLRLAGDQLDAIERHAKPGRILDVGASAGFFVKAAQDRGWTACGVELSADTARLARERYGVDVRTGTLEAGGFEDGTFDAVALWDVIEHVPDPVATMARVRRLLKPGGIVGLLTPNLGGLFSRASYRPGRRLGYWPAVEPPFHLFQFSLATLTRLLRSAGLEVLEVKHLRPPLSYTFGAPLRTRSLKRLAYAAVFAPFVMLGPRLGAGDEVLVVARQA